MQGQGVGENGIMHLKIVPLDDRVIYLGSANATYGHAFNREGIVRMTGGAIIQDILAFKPSAFADAIPLSPQ